MSISIISKPLTALTLFLLLITLKTPAEAAFWKENYYKTMKSQAEKLAKQPFDDPTKRKIPPELATIGYDQWRDITFRPEKAIWLNTETPFHLQFFHMGFLFKWPVKINVINQNRLNTVAFSPDLFDYGKTGLRDKVPPEFSFSGFRIHYPINTPEYADELVAFLGASYFRALAQGQAYGLSARGLAINTGSSSGEEFPFFKEYWIEQPSPNENQVTIYALLDSPSLTGAFQIITHPGKETVMDVRCTFFARQNIEKIGIAPLTSMYYFGENQPLNNPSDFRPEVHDSDGLLIHSGTGEWLWRPLINPERLLINTYNGIDVKGFGLFQRDRNFDHYLDLEARSDIRPSAWVQPKGDWGDGHLELMEIPSPNEYNDNVNIYWVPDTPLKAQEQIEYQYTLRWMSTSPQRPDLAYVTDTRMVRHRNKDIMFVIEWNGNAISDWPAGTPITPEISVTGGYTLTGQQLIKNTVTGGWRLVFHLERGQRNFLKEMIPNQRPTVNIRAVLKCTECAEDTPNLWTAPEYFGTISETWGYSFFP